MRPADQHAFGAPTGALPLGLAANYKTDDPQTFPQVSTPKSNVIHTFVHSDCGTSDVTLASPGCVPASRPVSHAAGWDAVPQDDPDDGPEAA